MLYQEFLPAPQLRPYIHRYGIAEEFSLLQKPIEEKLMPSLEKVLVFFYLQRQPVFIKRNKNYVKLPMELIFPLDLHCTIKHQGEAGAFWITFKPGKFRYFFHSSPQKNNIAFITLEELKDPLLVQLIEQLRSINSIQERIEAVDAFFIEKLDKINTQEDAIAHAIQMIHQHPNINIESIACALKIGVRHFRRLFYNEMGVQPKKYQKIVRFFASLKLLCSKFYKKESDVAYSNGYYDQSHFISEFKYFTGLTPIHFLKKEGLPPHFFSYLDSISSNLTENP